MPASRSSGGGGIGTDLDVGGGLIPERRPIPQYVAFDAKGTTVAFSTDGSSPTLRSMGFLSSHQNGGGHMAVCMENFSAEGSSWQVRRLTPRECERLQGFPDDYTLVPYGRGMASDGLRYKALGNSMAVNVMNYLGARIALVDGMIEELRKRS